MTRALVHLAGGEWSAAWQFHPLALLLVIAAAGAVLWLTGVRRWSWSPINRQLLDRGLLGTAMVFLLVWVIRMNGGTLPPVAGLVNQ